MIKYFRTLTVAALVSGLVGPFSMGTVFAQTTVPAAANQTTGNVLGTIKDNGGAPVANAKVTLSGPSTQSTNTDATGAFAFSNVAPGLYTLTATKAGYETASQPDLAVLSGQTQTLAVTMPALTFQSLRTIATVRASGRGTFNTTPASVSVVSSQTFVDQAQPQVMKILNQTPGIEASLPQTSANGAVPGAITFPNIRGALSFETASLIDGHPVSVGTFGDYVTTFLNSYALGSAEVVKGPGADAPEVNYAIGGTVNFRTKDPTYKAAGNYTFGVGSHGSALEHFGIGGTAGRLGYVLDYADNYDPGALYGYQAWFNPGGNNGYVNYNPGTGTGTLIGFNDTNNTVLPNSPSKIFNSFATLACCYTFGSAYDSRAELAKLRYALSGATSLTFTYLGMQTSADQNENTSSQTPGTFNPGTSYAGGSLAAGTQMMVTNLHPGGTDQEINNEPILEGDLRTTIGNDTLLARYYHASIDRLIHQGPANPWQPDVMTLNIQGTNSNPGKTGANITGTQNVAFFDYFNQEELDALRGYSLEWSHPFSENNVLTLSGDTTDSTTTSDSCSPNFASQKGGTPVYNINTVGLSCSVNVPAGSKQVFTTYQARLNIHAARNLNVTFTNYLNTYDSTYPTACSAPYAKPAPAGFTGPVNGVTNPNKSQCWQDGSGYVFGSTTTSHYDPRLSLEYRPAQDTAVRFAAGSAIAPPYLQLLSSVNGAISCPAGCTTAFQSVNAGTLKPETAFGYDLGADHRFHDGVTTISADVYMTNLFNHFITQTYNSGLTCSASPCPTTGVPLYYTSNVNLNNARFEGLELAIRHNPLVGFGWVVQGSTQRGYAYNLPPCFYTSTNNCSLYSTNLAVLPNINFTGGALCQGCGGLGGFSNQNLPYLQGFAQLSYRFTNGIYTQVNETLYGKNNSLNEPPFGIVNASVRFPVVNGIQLQVAGDNLTNAYTGLFPTLGTGVAIPLANGQVGATQANVLGPSTIRVLMTKNFGEGANPTP